MLTLSPQQARVIGVMLEKEITTPEQYPLSLNGLTNACNQKSSREPVMDLSESDVQNILDELDELHLISEQTGFGSRVVKYKHRFCNTEFGDLQFDDQQRALICVLLLRGAQSPGELRTRTNRLADFSNVTDVEASLDSLISHSAGTLVAQLAREPGKRDCRYVQLFSDIEPLSANQPDNNAVEASSFNENVSESVAESEDRIALLEQRVDKLSQQVVELTQLIDDLTS